MKITEYKVGMKPEGAISGMPDTIYHATDGFISKSGLDLVNRSPAHYFYREGKERTRHMVLGSATHTAILEPELFKRDYMILEGVTVRTAAAYKQAIKARDEDFTLTEAEGQKITAMQQEVYANHAVSQFIKSSEHKEISVFVKHPVYGVMVRVRFDLLANGFIGDLKTTNDARSDEFSKSIFNYRYDVQAAIYLDAYEWLTGEKLKGFKFLAVENATPHRARLFTLDDYSISIGRKKADQDFAVYAKCLESGIWNGYDGEDQDELISLPEWHINRFEDENETNEIVI